MNHSDPHEERRPRSFIASDLAWVGPCEEVGDGARDEDLVRVGVAADALSDVPGDTCHVVVLEFDLPLWRPARIASPSGWTSSRIAHAHRKARAGPSKVPGPIARGPAHQASRSACTERRRASTASDLARRQGVGSGEFA